jgi:hypothetical protein
VADSTAPIVAAGTITYANAVIGNGQPWNSELRVLVGTAVAAGLLALFEKGSRELAVGIAWIALLTSFLVTPKSGQSAVANTLRLTGLGSNS